MPPVSSPVTAGVTDVLAAQFNDVRTDAIARALTIPASAFTPATTNGAALALITTNGDKYELQFADGANALSAYALFQVPTIYNGGAITVRLHWLITGASQAVRWEVDVLAVEAGEDPDAAVANVASLSATSNGTSLRMTNSTITWSSSLPTAGDMLLFRIRRDPTHAGDTSTATAKLREVIVEFGS